MGMRESQEEGENRNSIFEAINFFKELESKFGEGNPESGLRDAEK